MLTGFEGSDGTLDPQHARGYWFGEGGELVKTYFQGIETQRSQFEEFGGVQIAHKIKVSRNGSVGILIRVTEASAAGSISESMFELPGHEYKRAFTEEVR